MTPIGFNFLNSAISVLDLIICNTSWTSRFHEDFLCEVIQWPHLNTLAIQNLTLESKWLTNTLSCQDYNMKVKRNQFQSVDCASDNSIYGTGVQVPTVGWQEPILFCTCHGSQRVPSQSGGWRFHRWLTALLTKGRPSHSSQNRAPLSSFQYYYFHKNYLLDIILGLSVRWNVWITLWNMFVWI